MATWIDPNINRFVGTVIASLMLMIAATVTPINNIAAMPPYPDVQAKIDRGEINPPKAFEEARDMPAMLKINAPSAQNGPRMAGPFRALCLLVDFSDKVSQVTPVKFDTLIFADKTGTVRNYYQEVSYAQIDLITLDLPSTSGWLRAPQTYAYYVDSGYGTDSPYPHNTQKLCEDLVDAADSIVDFSLYDNDGDGDVDVIMIVHAGRGAEFTGSKNDIWSHKWSINRRPKDGVNVHDYTIMPEYWINPGDMTIGVFCHELGHVFGLPDLYDTDNSSYGTGKWSLMSTGSWNGSLGSSPAHLDAWCRTQVGWATPTNIISNTPGVSIPAVESTATIFRLWTSGSVGNEYFLVENRQRTGYDATLPASGLLIWHIDEAVGNNRNEWYPGHTDFGHYMVALEQADSLYHLEKKQSAGDNGDPFPGATSNVSFSPLSNPNSDGYGASSSFVAVTNISASASTMTADFAVSFASANDNDDPSTALPRFALGQNYPNPFNPSTRFDFTLPSAGEVRIEVYNLLGQHVAQILSGTFQAGTHTAAWDGRDEDGRDAPSGIYLYELTNEDERVVRKMALLR
jgi:immune inhibitor A